ncbi:phosphotransferase [Lentibacillus cibarius]|uniref:Phosphotransferase n=1 Tax=Lentibacillus cibarius TaxID=2583219 RepID=A0A549YLS4_9BACI|nr:phosphotransferase [Lentibacillus cibarius]
MGKVVKWRVKQIEKAVNSYGFAPYYIEKITSRLFRVNDGRYDYALKRSRLSDNTIALWENVYHQAHTLQLNNILPVYITETSQLYTRVDEAYYYMTPWTRNYSLNHQQQIHNTLRTISEIHEKTKQTHSVDTVAVKHKFSDYRSRCRELQDTLLDYVKLFEQNRFMSPFELQVCTHYHVLVNVLAELDTQIDYFMAELEENNTWNYSLCHGNLHLSHTLHHHHAYIINWEKVSYDNAATDLAIFLQDLAKHYDQSPENLAEMYSSYSYRNRLDDKEWHLLLIYLLDPFHYIKLIEQYIAKESRHTMIVQQKMLQHSFRQLQLGLDWSSRPKSDMIADPETTSDDS